MKFLDVTIDLVASHYGSLIIWNFFILDVWELRQVLEAMGQKPTEEELFQMISEVDENMSGSIDFAEFLKVIENQKERAENFDDESDMIGEFWFTFHLIWFLQGNP